MGSAECKFPRTLKCLKIQISDFRLLAATLKPHFDSASATDCRMQFSGRSHSVAARVCRQLDADCRFQISKQSAREYLKFLTEGADCEDQIVNCKLNCPLPGWDGLGTLPLSAKTSAGWTERI